MNRYVYYALCALFCTHMPMIYTMLIEAKRTYHEDDDDGNFSALSTLHDRRRHAHDPEITIHIPATPPPTRSSSISSLHTHLTEHLTLDEGQTREIFGPISEISNLRHTTELKEATLSPAEQDEHHRQHLIHNAALAGGAISIFFWIRYINPGHVFRTAHGRFITGLEVPAFFAILKASLAAGQSLLLPAAVTGAGAFLWHQFKTGIEAKKELKELSKIIPIKTKRIGELETALNHAQQHLQHVEGEHAQDMFELLSADRRRTSELITQLQRLQTTITPLPSEKPNEIVLKLQKEGLPALHAIITSQCRHRDNIPEDPNIPDHLERENKERSWYNPKKWYKKAKAYIKDHCHLGASSSST